MGACCLLLSSLFFLFSGVSSRSSDKKTRPRQNKLLSTNLQTGRHHLLQAPDAHRGQQRRREDGEQQKEARKLKRKDGAREEKMKFPPLCFCCSPRPQKNFKKTQKNADNHRVPQAGHDGRAPAQHALGTGVHPRPQGEKELQEKRGKERTTLFNLSPALTKKKKRKQTKTKNLSF